MGKAIRKFIELDQDLVPEGYAASSIGLEFLDQVELLEPQIYPKGWSRSLVESELSNENSVRIGIFDKSTDVLIGYSFSRVVEDEFHLLNIGLLPKYRGSGLGSFLLYQVLKAAKEKSCSIAFLEVRESNVSALNLYGSVGFSKMGERKAYYVDNQENAVLMELSLL